MDNEITKNFIENFIDEDNESNRYGKRVHTRFPPDRTAIFILAMQNQSASTLASPKNTAA